MRPHHGREEIHPGRWKEMESNNNGTGATDALSTEERKYSTIRTEYSKARRKVHLHKKSLLNQIKQVCGFGQQVQQQHGNKRKER